MVGPIPQNPQLQPQCLGVTLGQCVYFYRTLFPQPGKQGGLLSPEYLRVSILRVSCSSYSSPDCKPKQSEAFFP